MFSQLLQAVIYFHVFYFAVAFLFYTCEPLEMVSYCHKIVWTGEVEMIDYSQLFISLKHVRAKTVTKSY
jgi:hypothetical protein